MAHCASCSAPILWAVTSAGKRMPVDREPKEDGNVVLVVAVTVPGGLIGAPYLDGRQHLAMPEAGR